MWIYLRGKRYKLVWKKPVRARGECDSPDTPGKKILVDPSLDPYEKAAVLIHEMLHACIWDFDEEAITEISGALACNLKRLNMLNLTDN